MNFSNKTLLLAIFTMSIAGSAVGQSSTYKSDTTSSAAPATSSSNSASWQNQHRLSKIMGMDVYDVQGKKIGDIKDVVMNQARSQIDYAVVSVGGVLGVGSKSMAVPWKSLQASADSKSYMLTVDRDALKKAPSFDSNRWPDMGSAEWINDVEQFWQGLTKGSSGSSGGTPESGSAGAK